MNEYSDIMVKIGMKDFDQEQLFSNFDAVAKALVNKKPESIKGKYFVKGYIKSTMSPCIKLDLSEYQKLITE